MLHRLFLACLAGLLGLNIGIYATTEPETARAIQDVRNRVEYVETILPQAMPEYLVALAVNSYVVGHVSAPAYGYLSESDRGSLLRSTDGILRAGAGICGEAATVAIALYAALGVESRRVVVWYDLPDGTAAGHTTTEVRYGDAWHWFDPTWGVFYEGEGVYALVDVIQMSANVRANFYVGNDSRLWMRAVRASGVLDGPLAFLGFPSVRVEVEGQVIYERTGSWGNEAADAVD